MGLEINGLEIFFAYSDEHRRTVGAISVALMVSIAFADWKTGPDISLGFLYIVPILLAAGFLSGLQIVALGAVCSLLRENFHPSAWEMDAAARVLFTWGAFAFSGLFVSELNRKRRLVQQHLKEREEHIRLRQQAEQQVRVLLETSPLAVLTLDHRGRVLLANKSASQLLGFDNYRIEGLDVRPFLPILGRILESPQPAGLRTTIECKAQRKDKEVFLAQIWWSTYETALGLGVAAAIWDASENLRDREGTGLDSMMATSRVLIGAVSHEIRNLACAATAVHSELLGLASTEQTEQTKALGSILQGLASIASSGLAISADRAPVVTELGTVLDEARIVIEPGIREAGGIVRWKIAAGLPLVQADHHGLLQVFLNLARNSQNAITESDTRELTVEACAEHDLVLVRFRDTGCGVQKPDELFRPFQTGCRSTGLGLFVSRAILRAHGGDLRYEPTVSGSCFAVERWPAQRSADV